MEEALAAFDRFEGPEPLRLLARGQVCQLFQENEMARDYFARAYAAIKTIMQRRRSSEEYSYLFCEIARNYGSDKFDDFIWNT